MPPNRVYTLIFIHDETHVLLGLKKRGFAEGRWNGFGGKPQEGETILESATRFDCQLELVLKITSIDRPGVFKDRLSQYEREVKEECGLDVEELHHIAILMFEFVGQAQLIEVHVFETTKYRGVLVESEEMRPHWYSKDALPFDEMWPDNQIWYPLIWKKAHFYGYFLFEGMDKILSYTLEEVSDVESISIPQGPQHGVTG